MRRLTGIIAIALLLAGCAPAPLRNALIDRLTPEQLAAVAPRQAPRMSPEAIVALSRQGTPPAAIVKAVQDSGTLMSADQIAALKKDGVHPQVTDYLADRQKRAAEATRLTEQADRDARRAARSAEQRQRDLERRRALEEHWQWSLGFGYWYPRRGFGAGTGLYHRPPYW